MLEFDGSTHTYRWDGVVVPSVTQILDSVLREYEGIPPDVLRAAQERGTYVHEATEWDDLGELDFPALDPVLAPYVLAWRDFRAQFDFRPTWIERQLYSPAYRYAGTCDRIGTAAGKPWLLDIKSGALVPQSVGPQTAAYYECALAEKLITRHTKRYCVHLRSDGTFRLHRCKNDTDFSVFLSCLNIHNWRTTP